jgi:hypothetical protein
MAPSSSGSPNDSRGGWHLDAFLLSIALERVTIKRFMLARVVAAAVVPRSAAESPGTFVVGWRPLPFGRRHSVRGSPPSGPILISFSLQARQRPVLDRLR